MGWRSIWLISARLLCFYGNSDWNFVEISITGRSSTIGLPFPFCCDRWCLPSLATSTIFSPILSISISIWECLAMIARIFYGGAASLAPLASFPGIPWMLTAIFWRLFNSEIPTDGSFFQNSWYNTLARNFYGLLCPSVWVGGWKGRVRGRRRLLMILGDSFHKRIRSQRRQWTLQWHTERCWKILVHDEYKRCALQCTYYNGRNGMKWNISSGRNYSVWQRQRRRRRQWYFETTPPAPSGRLLVSQTPSLLLLFFFFPFLSFFLSFSLSLSLHFCFFSPFNSLTYFLSLWLFFFWFVCCVLLFMELFSWFFLSLLRSITMMFRVLANVFVAWHFSAWFHVCRNSCRIAAQSRRKCEIPLLISIRIVASSW